MRSGQGRAITVAVRMSASLCAILGLWGCGTTAVADEVPSPVRPFVLAHCGDCHLNGANEGGVQLNAAGTLAELMTDRNSWSAAYHAIESGRMPPAELSAALTDEQRQQFLAAILTVLSAPDPRLGMVDPGRPVLRRLTRLEYNNSVRDLFELPCDVFAFPERLSVDDKTYFVSAAESLGSVVSTSMREYGQRYDVLLPQIGLAGDNRAEHGFANRGDSLNLSPLLMENYLELAAAIAGSERLAAESPLLARLLGRPVRPASPPAAPPVVRISSAASAVRFAQNGNVQAAAEGIDLVQSAFVSELTAAFEHGSGGVFDVPARQGAQAIIPPHQPVDISLGQRQITLQSDQSLWFAAFGTAQETSGDHLMTNHVKGQKAFQLEFRRGDSPAPIRHLGICVLSRAKQQGVVSLTAVLSDERTLTRQAMISEEGGNVFYSFSAPPETSIVRLKVDGSQFTGDYVLLDDLGFILDRESTTAAPAEERPAIQQPVADRGAVSRGPQSAALEATEANLPVAVPPDDMTALLREFVTRAFRRPATDAEVAEYAGLITSARQRGASHEQAVLRAVQAVLVAPEFLFLLEPLQPEAGKVRSLSRDEIASRMSYFLWASTPDAHLQNASTDVTQAAIRSLELRRLLAERMKSRELSESFATQWLRLDQLYSAKPDRELFPTFYAGPQGKSTLHSAMLIEALLLFETVLVENRPVTELIDADYTWLNGGLARLYGLEHEWERERQRLGGPGLTDPETGKPAPDRNWYRTPLPDRRRGGVLTMAGPLTLTSLPFRTSAVKRGAWVLETVFNRPPAEPKVAFVLDDAVPVSGDAGATTVRKRFELHRQDPNCNSCHSQIDPPGFALESFDAIGVWRTSEGDLPVDASGNWHGHQFDGPAGYKDALRAREHEFVRGFVEHLLSYSLGRKLEGYDMPAVLKIVSDSEAEEYRFVALLEGIVNSYPFLHTRNVEEELP